MGKINLLLTNANDNLKTFSELISGAVKEAEEYAFLKLKIDWDIDLIVTNHMPFMLIPEDGIGGRTYWHDLITICINEKKLDKAFILETFVHELCHAGRWGKNNEWANSLFDGIICEGIATYFEAEFAKTRPSKQYFIETILARKESENERILKKLRGQLDLSEYDYETIFFNGNNELPRWSGYSLGYYFVKKYLEKTGKTIEEAFSDKYADFRSVLFA